MLLGYEVPDAEERGNSVHGSRFGVHGSGFGVRGSRFNSRFKVRGVPDEHPVTYLPYLPLDPAEALQFTHQADMVLGQVEKEKIMELTTSWKEEGRAEGHAAGKAEGHATGKAEGQVEGEVRVVLRLLQRRCGAVPLPLQERVRRLSSDQLENLADALLDFTSAAELDKWLSEMAQ